MMGVDSFLLSNDAGVALVREGVADKPPTSQRDLAATRPRSTNGLRNAASRSTTSAAFSPLSVG